MLSRTLREWVNHTLGFNPSFIVHSTSLHWLPYTSHTLVTVSKWTWPLPSESCWLAGYMDKVMSNDRSTGRPWIELLLQNVITHVIQEKNWSNIYLLKNLKTCESNQLFSAPAVSSQHRLTSVLTAWSLTAFYLREFQGLHLLIKKLTRLTAKSSSSSSLS